MKGETIIKIYSKNQFFSGILALAMSVAYGLRGGGENIAFCVAFAAAGAVCFYRAFNAAWAEEERTRERKISETARKRFGGWAVPIRNFGIILVILGVILGWCMPGWILWFFIMLAGVLYTIIIEGWLKSESETN